MELKQIKELMAAMGRTGTKRISLKKEDFELVLEREDHSGLRQPPYEVPLDYSDEYFKHAAVPAKADLALSKGGEMPLRVAPVSSEPQKEEAPSLFITSPMVGTFYAAPSPEDASFIKVGDKIEKGRLVCIIEAMKVLNEIKAGVTGTIVEVLVETGQPVEFGTKLFRLV